MTHQEMARHALAARDLGDPRWPVLVMWLAVTFNCRFVEVEQQIVLLAGLQRPGTAHDYVPPHVWMS